MRLDPLGSEQVGRLARVLRRSGESKRATELFQRAELLAALSRVTTYALMNAQDRKSALIEAGALSHRLQFNRLALLFYTALLSEFPDLSVAREKVAELRQQPSALQPLSTQSVNEPTIKGG